MIIGTHWPLESDKNNFFWSFPLVSFKFRYLLLQLEFHSGYKCHCQLQYERPSRVIFSRVWTQGDKFCLCWLKVESPNTNMLLRDLLLLKNIEIKHLWKLKKHTCPTTQSIHFPLSPFWFITTFSSHTSDHNMEHHWSAHGQSLVSPMVRVHSLGTQVIYHETMSLTTGTRFVAACFCQVDPRGSGERHTCGRSVKI